MLRFVAPFALWLGPVVVIRTEVFADHRVLLALIGVHIAGCYWMLHALRPRAPRRGAQDKLTFMRLLVGAPLTVWLLAFLAAAFVGGEPSADWVATAGLSSIMVWPAILFALHEAKHPLDLNRGGRVGPRAVIRRLAENRRYILPTALWAIPVALFPVLSRLTPAVFEWVGLGCLAAHTFGACWMLYSLRGRRDLLGLRLLATLPATIAFAYALWSMRTDDTAAMVIVFPALIFLLICWVFWTTRSALSAGD